MQHSYYIASEGGKDGPHDLITIMRRIRAQKIDRDTLIYVDGADAPVAAKDVDDIALFFDRRSKARTAGPRSASSTWALLRGGWQFTSEHNIMTVYAGALLLICLMLAFGLVAQLGPIAGIIAVWCIYCVLQSFYLVFAIRLYRGQPYGSDFINQYLAPILPSLVLSSVMLALMIAGGWFLLLIPGLFVAVIYSFVPLLLLDKQYGIVEAMHASRLLLQKYARSYVPVLCLLVLLYLFCVVLIFPLPLMLPIFASALSQLYEELSAT